MVFVVRLVVAVEVDRRLVVVIVRLVVVGVVESVVVVGVGDDVDIVTMCVIYTYFTHLYTEFVLHLH